MQLMPSERERERERERDEESIIVVVISGRRSSAGTVSAATLMLK
jgi:hypothetical protein